MVDFHQQAQLFEWRCPSRSRDAMTRDMCHIWETHGIHEQAVHGHWRNGMANKLDGSEDRFIDRDARILWDENNMAECIRLPNYRVYEMSSFSFRKKSVA